MGKSTNSPRQITDHPLKECDSPAGDRQRTCSPATRRGASPPTLLSCRSYCGEANFGFQTQSYRRYFSSMIEKTPRARGMSEKELRARIVRVVAEEERTYGRLIELRDLLHAITGELDSATATLPNISNIIATPSRFRRSKP
jgi:hypothetical protein